MKIHQWEPNALHAMKHQILHSSLTKDGLLLMGSDMTGPDGLQQRK
ncbi:MAG: hypothetical protein WKG06_08220 [Segetibacter sp.]